MRHVPDAQIHQIAAPQLAADRQVKYGQVADLVFIMLVDSNGPDIL